MCKMWDTGIVGYLVGELMIIDVSQGGDSIPSPPDPLYIIDSASVLYIWCKLTAHVQLLFLLCSAPLPRRKGAQIFYLHPPCPLSSLVPWIFCYSYIMLDECLLEKFELSLSPQGLIKPHLICRRQMQISVLYL